MIDIRWATIGLSVWVAGLGLCPPCRADADVADPRRPTAVTVGSVPVIPDAVAERLRQYLSMRSANFRGWAPDGNGMLIQTRFGNTAQLHRVYQPGGRREQITFFDEPTGGRFVHDGTDKSLLLNMGKAGDENDQIYWFDRRTGKQVLLTDGKSRNVLGPVSNDGTKLVLASNRRNDRDTDLFLMDPRQPGSESVVLQTDREFWVPDDLSPCGTRVALRQYVSATESYPAILDLASRTKRKLPIAVEGKAYFGELAFAPGGRTVYFTSDSRGEFRRLGAIDSEDATRPTEWVAYPGGGSWDVDEIEVDRRTGNLAFAVNEGGVSALYVRAGQATTRVDLPMGVISELEFSPDSAALGFTLDRPDAPSDVYSVTLRDGTVKRWTYSEAGGLNAETFVRPHPAEYTSFDRRKIPAFYFRPRTASPERPAPVLISIHGGPESQYRPTFSAIVQFYVNELGVAVVAPNVRGSAGYGKTYLQLDNAEKREDSVRDIGALLDWVAKQPELDASRVAVIGGSYGGYMVLASLIHFGDRIRAGVDVVGIASFRTFLKNTSAYRQDLRRAEYGDERDPKIRAVFERIDPINHADRIRSALLVAHGKNDPRVPFSEAVGVVERVRASGRKVWTVYADNEGHGFRRKDNSDYLSAVIVLFLMDRLQSTAHSKH